MAANLYARIVADHKHVARQADSEVMTTVETWHEKVSVTLDANGRCIVRRGPKQGTGEIVWTGELDARGKDEPCPNCGGPEGYPSGHAVGCPLQPTRED